MKPLFPVLALIAPLAAAADTAAPVPAKSAAPAAESAKPAAPAAPAADESRLNLLRALAAADATPFIEPSGDLKAMLLRQNPELAAADCGVRYKELKVAGATDSLTLLVAPQGRCRNEPGTPPQWVLTVKVDKPR